jgi:hypothetical protein
MDTPVGEGEYGAWGEFGMGPLAGVTSTKPCRALQSGEGR